MSIYVKFSRKRTIKEFLIEFFKSEVKPGYLVGVKTYKDKECTDLQCDDNRYRSFDEVLELVNTYYKNVSAEKLINLLYNLELTNSQGKIKKFYTMYCSNIGKVTLLFMVERQLGYGTLKLNCKYSLNELSEMVKNK